MSFRICWVTHFLRDRPFLKGQKEAPGTLHPGDSFLSDPSWVLSPHFGAFCLDVRAFNFLPTSGFSVLNH